MARNQHGRRVEYRLRRSVEDGGKWVHQDLFNLGADPTEYIVYPGGNSFYFNPLLTETLEDLGVGDIDRGLEKLFLPFLEPEIQRIIRQMTRFGRKRRVHLSKDAMTRLQSALHEFDKRRFYFLRFGRMDRPERIMAAMKCYNRLLEKSRDELEHYFRILEAALRPREKKSYVYHALNLDKFFQGEISRMFPMGLDPEKLDDAFIKAICSLNGDPTYIDPERGESTGAPGLSPYLKEYVIIWFDFEFGQAQHRRPHLDEFINKHRQYKPPPPPPDMDLTEACAVLGITMDEFKHMSRRDLTRIYRKKAMAAHPDQGGDQDEFVRLNLAYERLLESQG